MCGFPVVFGREGAPGGNWDRLQSINQCCLLSCFALSHSHQSGMMHLEKAAHLILVKILVVLFLTVAEANV